MAHFRSWVTTLAAILLAGCTASAVEQDFGQSVHQMVESQKAHPEISRNPDPDYIDGTDAGRLSEAVKAYRSDVSKPAEVNQPIVLRIGSNQQ